MIPNCQALEINLDRNFQRMSDGAEVPAWCITRALGRCTHRFFDTCPISPSGRWLAVTRLPHEDHPPAPGEQATVVCFDLLSGEVREIGPTHAWDIQLGAQVQWGPSDEVLYFNDQNPGEWIPFAVQHDLASGTSRRLGGPVYMVSPDGSRLASPCLRRTLQTQAGYGAVVPREFLTENHGAPDDDGIYVTDAVSGRSRLLVSLAQIVEATGIADRVDLRTAAFYGFHVKWSPNGERLLLVLRNRPRGQNRNQSYVVTLDQDGGNIRLALDWSVWSAGGHHPNWHPDSEYIVMNLRDTSRKMRFVCFRYDGSGLFEPVPGAVGSGHPSFSPDGRFLLTDAYLAEKLGTPPDRCAPLRLINLATGKEKIAANIDTRPTVEDGSLFRIDPHPAWHGGGRFVAFNGRADGTRQVFVADLASLLSPVRNEPLYRKPGPLQRLLQLFQ